MSNETEGFLQRPGVESRCCQLERSVDKDLERPLLSERPLLLEQCLPLGREAGAIFVVVVIPVCRIWTRTVAHTVLVRVAERSEAQTTLNFLGVVSVEQESK